MGEDKDGADFQIEEWNALQERKRLEIRRIEAEQQALAMKMAPAIMVASTISFAVFWGGVYYLFKKKKA